MLHRSFKPAKCKTSLKMASSRIKLMKNKRGVQMNQMKRELAQLLESGQDRTARIRLGNSWDKGQGKHVWGRKMRIRIELPIYQPLCEVEHLIREEKTVAAYDLIEIYCELIAARMPIIESQKNCPIDLKEAITSVIFASPRCADIPELLDVKKHFTAKYGKEFITAALELRPDCGVGRMLVEKLSAVAPDGQSKVKVLNTIAEEHNIKWDSQLLEEKDSKPADDLLNGPSTFEKASEMHTETPTIQVPNFQDTSSHDKHVRPLNFNETNSRSSLGTQKLLSTDLGGIKTTTATTHPDLRSSGRGAERMDVGHSFSEDDTFSSGRQNWNMDFKDATSAARAAAESAERASMAARAAVELSIGGNISRQYSTESQKSTHSVRHEGPVDYAAVNNSFHDRNSKLQNEHIGGDAQHSLSGAGKRFHEDVLGNTERSKHSDSLRSSKGSIDDDTFVNRVQKTHGYSEKSSFKETIKAEKDTLSSKIDMKKKYVESGGENVSRWKDDFSSENFDQFGEERTGKQYSMSSSRSNSSTDIDDDDSHLVDTRPKYEGESTSYMPSLGRNSPTFGSTTADDWSPRRDLLKSPKKSVSRPHFSAESHSSPLFSESLEKYVDPLEPDNVPVTTYDSDGPKFDREDESEKSMYSGTNDSSIFSHKQNVFSQGLEPTHGENYGLAGSLFVKRTSSSGRRPRSESSSDDSDSKEVRLENKPVTVINAESPKKFDSRESIASHLSLRSGKSQMELNDTGNKSYFFIPADERNIRQSSRLSMVHIDEDNVHTTGSPDEMKDDELFNQYSSESANKLNFGTLTGGFRHKGYRHPPYNRNPSGDASSLPNKEAEESSSRTSFNSSMRNNAEKNSSFGTSITSSDSDSDLENSEEEVKKTTSRRQAPYAQKSSKEVNMKSTFRPPAATYYNRDNDYSEEDILQQVFPNRGGHLGSGSSRRTKASPSSTGTSSFSKVGRDGSEASVSPNSSNERKATGSGNVSESSTNLKFQTRRRPDHKDSEEQPSSIQQASSKEMPVSKISSREENISSSAVGQPSSPSSNKGAKGSLQNLKTSPLKAEPPPPPTREDSAKRASHVHPKLPDYDSIAAHLQSLRKDRQ